MVGVVLGLLLLAAPPEIIIEALLKEILARDAFRWSFCLAGLGSVPHCQGRFGSFYLTIPVGLLRPACAQYPPAAVSLAY